MATTLEKAFEGACRRHRDVAFEDLLQVDQVLVSIWALEGDVNNGGFHQYYFNTSGDTAYYAPAALRAIGALTAASIVEKANEKFGPSGPPIPREQRQEALSALPSELWDALDREFFAYPDDISALLQRFIDSRR